MNGDQAASVIWAIGALVLVVSGYAARRVSTRATVKMAMAWVAIFGAALAVLAFWRTPL